MLAAAGLTGCGSHASARTVTTKPDQIALVSDPSSLVNLFAGTGTGGVSPGSISEFPGADVPFGMMQWSPDTSPDRINGSGYSYADSHISGFSLTHLSGTGCAAYGDIPVLPTVGAVGSRPFSSTETFSHTHEAASPGRYSVELGPSGINVALSVTTRTGLSQITFPSTSSANVLFKVAGSAEPRERDQRPHSRRQRGDRSGHERPVLPDGNAVHAVLRRVVRPPFQGLRDMGRRRRLTGPRTTVQAALAGLTCRSTPRRTGRCCSRSASRS